ncbi:TetR/AcrR family transcriptional regulator [Actinosynnema sp. NPDC053489]|uniref:TetR/AcrR family transcriptional regulator n=1 Tax=Actinosynnema sp. NPDC053489 TaxID=3363916 RepID=UPI0037C554EA
MAADPSARERILRAAEELFAEAGFDATPTSRIAERAAVPKGLVHYYFRRKADLLAALVQRLPDGTVDARRVVVVGDIAESLRRLVAALDARLDASPLLSHLLWREADTHKAVRDALHERYESVVRQIRDVILAAGGAAVAAKDVDSASALLAHAVSYRHSVARHAPGGDRMDPGLSFVAAALEQP